MKWAQAQTQKPPYILQQYVTTQKHIRDIREKEEGRTLGPVLALMFSVMVTALSKKWATFSKSSSVRPLRVIVIE